MSVKNRSIARLPQHVFENVREGHSVDVQSFRKRLCEKLKTSKEHSDCLLAGNFINQSALTLMHALDPLLTFDECRILRQRIAVHCAPSPRSALKLLRPEDLDGREPPIPRRLTTGMTDLDASLRGGFCVGTISELVGRAGVGKTQLATQLCVANAAANGGTVYVDTEQKLSLSRLEEIAAERHRQLPTYFRTSAVVLKNVAVRSARSTQDLLETVRRLEEEILDTNLDADVEGGCFPVRLLVVDSIAAPARREFGEGSAPQRAAIVLRIAQTLKRLADQLGLVVVVVNQVATTHLSSSYSSYGQEPSGIKAALGTSWHHCLSTRIFMENDMDLPQQQGGQTTQKRRATIVKSNEVALQTIPYEITTQGVVPCHS